MHIEKSSAGGLQRRKVSTPLRAKERRSFVDEPISRRLAMWIGVALIGSMLVAGALIRSRRPAIGDVIAATPVAERKGGTVPQGKAVLRSYPPVTLPTGLQIDRASVLNYDLAEWLGTVPTHPRTFTFDRINFAPGSAAMHDEGRPLMQVLSQILTAYPQARVVIIGNGPGSLGQERAVAIRQALLALAADPDLLSVRAGDASESAPRLEVKLEMGVGSDLDA